MVLLVFTETQVRSTDSDQEIKRNLQPFQLYRKDNSDKYMSLAVCFRNTVTVSHHEYFSAVNGLKFVVCHTKSLQTFKVLLLYRKNNSNIHQYINSFRQILATCPVDVILGDFNVDLFEDNQIRELKMLMNSFNFTQIILAAY